MKKLLLCVVLLVSVLAFAFKDKRKKIVQGVASYYHNKFEGRRTANGGRYRKDSLTAASNFFPLNAYVKVTNLKNDSSVIVKITDRTAAWVAKKGRVVDLSKAAAMQLNFLKSGLASVQVEIFDFEAEEPTTDTLTKNNEYAML